MPVTLRRKGRHHDEHPALSERQTVAGAYQKIESHEELCAERYASIHEKLTDFKGTLNKIVWGVISILLSVVGFMAVQLWESVKPQRMEPPPAIYAGPAEP